MAGDECIHCHRPRSAHTDDLLGRCPGQRYGFYKNKYDHNGNLDCEATDEPVCPHCGERDQDWWESIDGDEEEKRVTCGHCQQIYDVEIRRSIDFTTTIPDLETEAWEEHADRERKAAKLAHERELAATMPPGTPVRVRETCYWEAARGTLGHVANEEMRDGFVSVVFDGHDYKHGLAPSDLEVIK